MPAVKSLPLAADFCVVWNRDEGEAGRSTRAYYEKRLGAWRRANRVAFLALLLVVAVLAIPLWLYAPLGQFFAGAALGGAIGMIYWVWDDPPDFIAKWRRGADGEQQTARALRTLASAGWSAVHDRTTGRGNLDHAVVGPGGVFVLETKNLNGTITVEEAGLTAVYGSAAIDAFTNHKLARAMTASAHALRNRIREVTRLSYPVRAIVVVWGYFPEGFAHRDRVTYIAGERLAEWLDSQPRRLSDRDTNLIRLALQRDDVLPPAPELD